MQCHFCFVVVFCVCLLLDTGTDADPPGLAAELKTIPQIRSTQTDGVPDWALGLLLFVAQGMEIQSVRHPSVPTPTLLPSVPCPVMLKDMAGALTEITNHR